MAEICELVRLAKLRFATVVKKTIMTAKAIAGIDMIGQFIRHYRKKAGFTHAELAKRLNYSRTAIVKWEGGKMPFVKLEPFIGLARAFKIKPGRFLDLYEKWEQENIHKPAN